MNAIPLEWHSLNKKVTKKGLAEQQALLVY